MQVIFKQNIFYKPIVRLEKVDLQQLRYEYQLHYNQILLAFGVTKEHL